MQIFSKDIFFKENCFSLNIDKDIDIISIIQFKEWDSPIFEFKIEKNNKILSKEAIRFIENEWEDQKIKNDLITNGSLFDINKIQKDSNKVLITGDKTYYKYYLGTKNIRYASFFRSGNYVSNHASCGALFFTKDNKILIGYKKKKQKFSLIGGMMDFKDLKSGSPFDFCLLREISEEVGNLEIISKRTVGIFLNIKTNHTNILYHAHLNLSGLDIIELYLENLKNKKIENELNHLILIENKKTKIIDFLKNAENKIRGIEKTALSLLI